MLAFAFSGLTGIVMAQSRLIVKTRGGATYELEVGGAGKVVLPVKVTDVATGATLKLGVSDVVSIVSADSSKSPDGVTRREVQCVAMPSLIRGKKNTSLRLLDVMRRNSTGTVYRWEQETKQNGESHFGLWYGVKPEGAESVYPFIQDGKVWFRDMKMVLGATCHSFVEAANEKYLSGKNRLADQEDLKRHPIKILDLQVK